MDNNTRAAYLRTTGADDAELRCTFWAEERGDAGENNMPLSYFQVAAGDRTQPTWRW
jgi:hypothetical protein